MATSDAEKAFVEEIKDDQREHLQKAHLRICADVQFLCIITCVLLHHTYVCKYTL